MFVFSLKESTKESVSVYTVNKLMVTYATKQLHCNLPCYTQTTVRHFSGKWPTIWAPGKPLRHLSYYGLSYSSCPTKRIEWISSEEAVTLKRQWLCLSRFMLMLRCTTNCSPTSLWQSICPWFSELKDIYGNREEKTLLASQYGVLENHGTC